MNHLVYDRFCKDIAEERKSQEEKHGEKCFEIPDSSDSPAGRETYETIARNSCNRAFKEGRLTNAHILDEEASEALTAAAKGDVDGLKAELVQTAAVCLAWLEAIEKREGEARVKAEREARIAALNAQANALAELVDKDTFRPGDKVRVKATGQTGVVLHDDLYSEYIKGMLLVKFEGRYLSYYKPEEIERVEDPVIWFRHGDKVRVKVTGDEWEVYSNFLSTDTEILLRHPQQCYLEWFKPHRIERI